MSDNLSKVGYLAFIDRTQSNTRQTLRKHVVNGRMPKQKQQKGFKSTLRWKFDDFSLELVHFNHKLIILKYRVRLLIIDFAVEHFWWSLINQVHYIDQSFFFIGKISLWKLSPHSDSNVFCWKVEMKNHVQGRKCVLRYSLQFSSASNFHYF